MEIVINCLVGLFELQLWLIFVQPFRIIQYLFRLFRLDVVAKVIGYFAYPACYIIIVLESFRDTLGDDGIFATVPQALGLRAQYHIKGPNDDIMYNSNPLSNGLTAHCYCAQGFYDKAKTLYLKSLCLFSWFLLMTQISGKKKRVSKYRGTIDQMYNEKKYNELVAFYESNPKMQDFATSQHICKYIFSLWYSGNTKKALKLVKDNKTSENDNRFDELLARDCENKGELEKALRYFRSAKLDTEEKRISDIIDERERALVFEMEKLYNNKEYTKVIEFFEKNDHLAKRYNGVEIVSQYIYSIYATAGVSKTLVSAIERYPEHTNKEWEHWQGEYYETQGEFLKAAEHYKSAGLMQDYQRMLDKEEERKRIEEEKRVEREKQTAQELERKEDFLAAAEHYKSANMIQEHDRSIAKAVEQAKEKENNGLFGDAAVIFKALGMSSDYERTHKKDHDQKIVRLKEKIKNDDQTSSGDVIKIVESCPELLDDEEIVDCYLWSLWWHNVWSHNGTEEKTIELVNKYAKQFNTTRWEAILGQYYDLKKENYEEALKHYKIAGMDDEIKEMEEKIEEKRRKEEEERRRKEEEERRRKEEEERKRKEKEEATKKMQEYLNDAIEGCDEEDLERAIEYAKKAGADDYETMNMFENLKYGIRCMNNEEYRDAKRYFNKAGITHWNSQLDILANSDYSSYSSYGGGGCSECSNACKGGCGRSCSNGCSGSCTTSCGTACSVGRNKRKS